MSGWNVAVWFSVLTAAALKGTVVLAAAWLMAILLRRRSAAVRHLVWTVALAAILAMPFLTALLPVWRIPVAGMLPAERATFQDTATASAQNSPIHSGLTGRTTPAVARSTWRPGWEAWLTLLWAVGAFFTIARTVVGYAVAWRASWSAEPFAGLRAIPRRVTVLEGQAGSMPVTLWLGHSVILMPAGAEEWSEERRQVVLQHELAHVRRHDALTQLLARAALAMYWWHPLAWTAWREFLRERERAADDLVLSQGARATDYAGHLLEIARSLQTRPALAWVAPAMARPTQLEGRLLAILDSRVDRAVPGRTARFACALLGAALILPLAAVRAQDPQAVPADIEAAIRTAQSGRNYAMLETAARAATQSKQYDAAQKLLDAALAIRAQVAGEQSVEYGAGLVQLAELEQKRDPAAGEALLAKAVAILGERPQASRALTGLGLLALLKKDYAPAFNYYQHAQMIDPSQAAISLMWMAVVRQTENNPDDAERLYQSALAAKNAQPSDSAVVMRVYAAFLKAQGRTDESAALIARAGSVQQADARPEPGIPAGVYRMGKGIQPPKLVRKEEPQYSEEARAAKLEGTAVVQVVIGIDGRAHQSRVVREVGLGLDENALEAISQWEFQPGSKDGQPVPVAATIEVNFRLL